MKKEIFIIIPVLISITFNSLACQCSSKGELNEARELEFEYSEIIIVGEVNYLSQDRKSFEIKIIEIFKGQLQIGHTIPGKNNHYCEPYIDNYGKWLIYGKFEKDTLTINVCGLSRSFEKPEENRYFRTPPPPPIHPDSIVDKKTVEKEFIERKEEDKKIAFKELDVELTQLRNKKRK